MSAYAFGYAREPATGSFSCMLWHKKSPATKGTRHITRGTTLIPAKYFCGHSLLRNVHHTAFSTAISRTQLTREIHLPSEPKGTFSLLIPSLYRKMAHYLHGHCLYLIIPNYCIIWIRVVKSEFYPCSISRKIIFTSPPSSKIYIQKYSHNMINTIVVRLPYIDENPLKISR